MVFTTQDLLATVMRKVLRSLLFLSALTSPLVCLMAAPAIAQERQGCFMITASGQLIDLVDICPSPPVQTPSGQALGTGDIQATLRWTTTDDLDLAVTDPSGNTVTYFNPNIPSGGQLDVDANAGCSSESPAPIENIFWPVSRAPQGNYTVAVNLYSRCQGSGPVSFNLTLLVRGETQTLTGTVDEDNPIATFPFSLEPQSTAAQPAPPTAQRAALAQ